jgi:hypothetical protein
MDPITLKVVLIAWMFDVQTAGVMYFMPIMVMQDDATCQRALVDLKETHKRGYAYNLAIRGACIPANIGG